LLRLAGGFIQGFGSGVTSVLHAGAYDDAVGSHSCHTDAPNGSGSLCISLVSVVHRRQDYPSR